MVRLMCIVSGRSITRNHEYAVQRGNIIRKVVELFISLSLSCFIRSTELQSFFNAETDFCWIFIEK